MILRNPRVLLAGVGIAAALGAAASLRFFSHEALTALPGSEQAGGPEQAALEADNVQVVGRSEGKVRWRVAAELATLSRDRHIISVAGIQGGLLDSAAGGGRPVVSLASDHASYATPFGVLGFSGTGALRVEGHVRASVHGAYPSLRTEQVVWDAASNTLTCPGAVTAALPKLTVSAGNAQYLSPPDAPARGVMRLGGGIQARFSSTRGLATLDCPGLTWSADAGSGQTTGPVTARIPGGLGTASAASIVVSTRTGDLTCRGFQGTLRLSPEVQ